MERMHNVDFSTMRYSALEHRHRYAFAANLARGRVLDIACGVGYGAEFICQNQRVTCYCGVDNSELAIAEARAQNSAAHRSFEVGNISDLNLASRAFDTVVCLETLEHVREPRKALAQLRRVLNDDGILVGSVPDASFDAFVSEHLGSNEFHFHRFSAEDVHALLSQHFEKVLVGYAAMTVASVISVATPPMTDVGSHVRHLDGSGSSYGSYYFLAGSGSLPPLQTDIALGIPFFDDYARNQRALHAQARRIAELTEVLSRLPSPIEVPVEKELSTSELFARVCQRLIGKR